jgi:hypothetical protein
MNNEFKTITSTRRNQVLMHSGYYYNQDREKTIIIRWRCTKNVSISFDKRIKIINKRNIITIKVKCRKKGVNYV